MSAIERAEHDLSQGDVGLARVRLASFLSTNGYDPAILVRLGDLSHRMQDLREAGRYWLLSSAEGEHVEQAVTLHCASCGNNAHQIICGLPRVCLLDATEDYPDAARRRIAQRGLADEIRRLVAQRRVKPRPDRMSFAGRLLTFALFLILAFVVICTCVGVVRVISWLWGGQ